MNKIVGKLRFPNKSPFLKEDKSTPLNKQKINKMEQTKNENIWDICYEADKGCENAKDPIFFERFCNKNYNSCPLIYERTITLCTYKRER